MDSTKWPELKKKITDVFAQKTRAEWCDIMEGTDICFAPVLSLDETYDHPHNKARETIVEIDGVKQPNVAPRFSRTKPEIQGPAPKAGAHTEEVLKEWGLGDKIDGLKTAGAI
jgi:alpha-methylacyl-CoA racemase